MRAGVVGVAVHALTSGLVVCACTSERDREELPPVVVGMLETTAPTYDDGEQKIYQVTHEVKMPFRRPKDGERPKGDVDPYPDAPFQVASDTRTTVRFTLSNLEDKEHTVELLIDPWNEFVHYEPGITMVRDDEVLPNFSGIQRIFILPPKSRIEGIITPDDMIELATDLTVAMALDKRPPDAKGAFGGALLYNRTFNIQNRSSQPDPVLQPWMPGPKSTIAAIIGFDAGLRTSEAARIAVELVIDVQDLNGDRIVMQGDDNGDKAMGRPGDALTPPAGGPAM